MYRRALLLSSPVRACAVLAATLICSLLWAGSANADTASSGAQGLDSAAVASSGPGYWLAGSDGAIYPFGTSSFGSLVGKALNRPIVSGAGTPTGAGYWLTASDGGVFTFGDARFLGSTGGMHLNRPVVGMAATPTGNGYWLVASDGGIFTFGDARFYGSMGNRHLNKPIVAMAATPTGNGYWLVASDGGIFTFGDARFYGSMGNRHLNKPIVGMSAAPGGNGYWLVASDGGIFTFGPGARFYGSTGGMVLNKPIVAMATDPATGGYWLAAADGGLFTFNAPFLGSTGGRPISAPVVDIISTTRGFPFPPGSSGYDVWAGDCPPPTGIGLPGGAKGFAVVQMAGSTDGFPNPCYNTQAAWAGANLSAYIFMTGLPALGRSQGMSGPAGNCSASNAACQSWNYGYNWARYWVGTSHGLGVYPNVWWLDVEAGTTWSKFPASDNAALVAGAASGLHSAGVIPGIYSTSAQWSLITGGLRLPGIALWIPGAGAIASSTSGAPSALQVCAGTASGYQPFAGGDTVLVQTGWFSSPYPGRYLTDYACK